MKLLDLDFAEVEVRALAYYSARVNYIVVCSGHVSLFDQSEDAHQFAQDAGGQVFNMWGLITDWQDTPSKARGWYHHLSLQRYQEQSPEERAAYIWGTFR